MCIALKQATRIFNIRDSIRARQKKTASHLHNIRIRVCQIMSQ
jgi:hypothetical protein